MNGHHLILGELDDFITGESIKDTHDERYRQQLAQLLVNRKGYLKGEVEPRKSLLVRAGRKKAIIKIDFIIKLVGKVCMVIKYGPGSIVTRRRPLLAVSRVIEPYQVPIAVVTNGEDADSGKPFNPLPADRAEMESRIVYCYEVDGSCPCDEDICKL